ncbi:hypothetical protein TCAL_05568, partial [Tigriopus californicus]
FKGGPRTTGVTIVFGFGLLGSPAVSGQPHCPPPPPHPSSDMEPSPSQTAETVEDKNITSTTTSSSATATKNNGTTGLAGGGADSTMASPAKRARVSADESMEEKDFDEETQKALEEIDSSQNEIDALNEKASEEILKVEQKYNKLRRPFYERRNKIIQRIPKFWLTAFINHPQVSSIIEEDEEEALQYLNKLEVEEYEDIKSGYRIKLHFDKNPYFDNEILTKEFQLGSSGDPASISTLIQWKEGQDLVAKAAMKAAASKGGRKRVLENRTFFTWFNDNTEPSADDVAEVIKDDMWPNPLQYFLVPDVEIENGGEDDEDDLEDEEEVCRCYIWVTNVVVLEEEDEEGDDDDEESGGGGGEDGSGANAPNAPASESA